jgi:hypothetical protein
MKTTILIITVLFSTLAGKAQNEKFNQAMLANIEKSKTATTQADFQDLANNFERIASARKTEWTAWYYAAFYNLVLNFREPDMTKKMKYVTLAEEQIEAGLALKPEETELMVIRVMSYYAEMAIDPAKGMSLLGEANALIDKAKSINPDNPRIYMEQAEAINAMPAEFGGGVEKARPILLLAKEKFDKFVPADQLAPDWGKDRCELLLSGSGKGN